MAVNRSSCDKTSLALFPLNIQLQCHSHLLGNGLECLAKSFKILLEDGRSKFLSLVFMAWLSEVILKDPRLNVNQS